MLMVNHFLKTPNNNTARGYIMSKTNNNPIWGMTHVFGVYVLWGRETSQSFETVLGEFKTLESLKEFAEQHHNENAWAQYRAGRI